MQADVQVVDEWHKFEVNGLMFSRKTEPRILENERFRSTLMRLLVKAKLRLMRETREQIRFLRIRMPTPGPGEASGRQERIM